MGGRIYSEKEAAELLQKAAKLQEQGDGTGYSAGVTLEELRRIAEEAGIAPDFLDKAIADGKAPRKEASLFNLVEETEQVVEGEIAPSETDLVVQAMRREGTVQALQQIGRTTTAQVMKGPMSARVDVSSRQGRTRVQVRSSPLMAYFLGLHTPLILATVAGPVVGRANPLAGIACSAGLLLAGWFGFTGLAKVGKRKAREMGERIAAKVEEVASEAPRGAAQEDQALRQQLGDAP